MIIKKKKSDNTMFFSAEDTLGIQYIYIYSVYIIVVEAELVFTLKEHVDSLFHN